MSFSRPLPPLPLGDVPDNGLAARTPPLISIRSGYFCIERAPSALLCFHSNFEGCPQRLRDLFAGLS